MYQKLIADWKIVAFGFVLTLFTSPGQTFFLSLFSESLQSDFQLSEGQFGLLYSTITLFSAFTLIFTGQLIDRFHLRKLILIFMIILAIGCFITASAYSLWALLLGFYLMRHLGQGLLNHAGAIVPVRYFPNDKSKALSITSLGFSFGEAILPSIIVLSIGLLGWRGTLWSTGGVILLLALPLVFWLLSNHDTREQRYLSDLHSPSPTSDGNEAVVSRHRSEVLKDYRFYLVLPALMAGPFFFTGYIIHQIHWLKSLDWDLSWWAAWFVGFAIVKILSGLIIGPFVDRWSAAKHLPFMMLPLLIGFITLALFEQRWAGVVFLLMFGLNNAWTNLVNAPLWADCYGRQYLGSIKSMTTAAMVFSSALSPVLLGFLFDLEVSFRATLLGSILMLTFSQILAIKASRDYLRH